ncbi:DUF763 domain-containing protein [Candidatus Bathyarchaeota archaeon]|nr:DUF763 domain-containing protein [Candidatus Bathyarchaeota archaeon]
MPRTGFAELPLHGGKAPPWLVQRMQGLSEAMVEEILDEYGSARLIRKASRLP